MWEGKVAKDLIAELALPMLKVFGSLGGKKFELWD